jgi:hypothetical protein
MMEMEVQVNVPDEIQTVEWELKKIISKNGDQYLVKFKYKMN